MTQAIRFLTQHVPTHQIGEQTFALELSVSADLGETSEWVNVTDWDMQAVRLWLGY